MLLVQFCALLRKAGASGSQRGVSAQLASLFQPLLLALLFAAASYLGESEVPVKTGVDRVVHVGDPFATKYAARLCEDGVFAVAPADGLGADFRRLLSQRSQSPPRLVAFEDSEAVEDYVKAPDYGERKKPPLCGAVIFDPANASKYTIRLNGTIVGNRAAPCGCVDTRRPLTGRAIDASLTSQDWYLCSGFLSFQRLIDEFLTSGGRGNGWQLELDVLPFPTPSFKQRKALSSLREFMSLFLCAFFAYSSGQVTGWIVAEREEKLLEAMKLMGLNERARFLALGVQVLPLFVIYGLQLAAGLDYGVFQRCDVGLLCTFMACTGLSFAAVALCASACFETAKTASLGMMVGLFGLSRLPLQALGLPLPPVALLRGLEQLIELELAGPGLQWSNLWQSGAAVSMGQVMLVQALSVPCFLFLWTYLEKVVPHGYGASGALWRRSSEGSPAPSVTRRRAPAGKIVEETLPVACTVEVKGADQRGTDDDGKVVAVKHLDLGLAEGEILALLGHNGAGKSTTVGMLTGVIPPTKGRVTVHGYDAAREPQQARQFLGVCPQHDILFDSLNCDQHLRLACALRGGGASANAAQELLRSVGLHGHLCSVPAGQLSSGRRRALCVALAFVGDPRFILLDEPTSGMDPFVRTSMWQLLKKYRPGRALCLSTHYMDEAEMLGDHVCILSRGALQCYGSPEWLKARLGSGYTLTLARSQGMMRSTADAAKAALELLQRNAPRELRSQLSVVQSAGSEAVLRVPFSAGGSFPELLRVLDSQKNLLGFASVSVSATTLEELFLRLADGEEGEMNRSPSTQSGKGSTPQQSGSSSGLSEQVASNMPQILAELAESSQPRRVSKVFQFSALLRKRWLGLQRNRRAMLCLCLLPLAFNVLGIVSIMSTFELDSPALEIYGTAQAMNSGLAAQGKPSMVLPYGAPPGWRRTPLRSAQALVRAGESSGLWHTTQLLDLNARDLRATNRRRTCRRRWSSMPAC
ncbi:unnamed protein product [Effrenium voratum]|nr:unnamed protein product [Effrenium voratum]